MKTILTLALLMGITALQAPASSRPNILFLFSDDHALKAISAYQDPVFSKIAPTPNIDRIANEGAIFENSFVANSICGPSRACILTGKHSHKNGRMRNDGTKFDGTQWTSANALQAAGYTTCVIGKWHLVSHPVGFDYWEVLPGQGKYYNPEFIQMDGSKKRFEGYASDVTTDKGLAWLERRDKSKPFFLMLQHKAPHRTFAPALRHLDAFDDVEIPEPSNLFDDYSTRSKTLGENELEIDRHFHWAYDAKVRKDEMKAAGVKLPGPNSYGTPEYNRMTDAQKKAWDAHFGPKNQKLFADFKAGKLTQKDLVRWKYQRYLRNYLGTVKGVDENIGRVLDYLEENDLADNTIVVYSSDQGFYLGEHGWYDKRWMFEQSFKMPFLIKWPGVIKPGTRPEQMIQNIDYAPTFCDAAGVEVPSDVQGKSMLPLFKEENPEWRDSVYYAYYEVGEHNVPQHFGVRTKTHKLFYLPATDEWQMFDLVNDPDEMKNIYDNPEHAQVREELTKEYHRIREHYDAPSYEEVAIAPKRKKKTPKPRATDAPAKPVTQ
jgi:N-acetylglucosamine-6-sulfatase